MGLFERVTKTRVWADTGYISFNLFINAHKEKSITISLTGNDGKKHSITLYKGEVEQLDYLLKQGKFDDKSTYETV